MPTVEHDEWVRVSAQVAAASTLAEASRLLCHGLARMLGQPVALLSRDATGWRFEAEGFPRTSLDQR